MSSFEPHLKIIGIYNYPNVLKEEKKKQKYTTHKTLMKKILLSKQNISYNFFLLELLIFET